MTEIEVNAAPTSPSKTLNAYRVILGLFYLAAAMFNTFLTLPNAPEALEAFQRISWPGPMNSLEPSSRTPLD